MHEAHGNRHANSPEDLTHLRRCRMAVLAYLGSAPGADTPADIGWLLMHLDWLTVGCLDVPSENQVHATRVGMEELAYLLAQPEASERFEEDTGVYCRRSYRRQGPGSN
jgi:hypothetical protein